MSEPIASPVCTYALIASGVTCSVFGLDAEAMVFGFVGGLIAQSYIPPKNDDGSAVKPWRAFLLLVAGAVIAAVFYPFADRIVGSVVDGVPKHAVKIAAAFALGVVAPLVPGFLRGKMRG